MSVIRSHSDLYSAAACSGHGDEPRHRRQQAWSSSSYSEPAWNCSGRYVYLLRSWSGSKMTRDRCRGASQRSGAAKLARCLECHGGRVEVRDIGSSRPPHATDTSCPH